MAHDVFISYSHHDKTTADAMCSTLEAKGRRCWIAPRDVLPGTSWGESIIDAIGSAKIMVLIFSSFANESGQVAREVERAVNKGLIILPFRIQDVQPSKTIEYFISTRHWLDALAPPLERHLQDLCGTIDALLSRRPDLPRPPTPVADMEALAGQSAGAYILRDLIGSGGSGFVYRAWNGVLGREACVKIFRPLRDDFAALAGTIARSVRGLASLDHPNIIKVYDFGRFDVYDLRSFYMAMEFIDGMSLTHWNAALGDDIAAIARRWRVAIQIAQALQAAHACKYVDDVGFEQTGVLHGDLKPANIRVRQSDVPVLLDFMAVDVQRLLDLPPRPPSAVRGLNRDVTAIFGTPGFMAPEQETFGIVTTRSDIYALGVTIGQVFRRVPDSLLALLDDMTKPNPQERPANMGQVVERLIAARTADGVPLPE